MRARTAAFPKRWKSQRCESLHRYWRIPLLRVSSGDIDDIVYTRHESFRHIGNSVTRVFIIAREEEEERVWRIYGTYS